MYEETYPKVSSKSNKKHRSYRNSNDYVKDAIFWNFWPSETLFLDFLKLFF